MNERAIIGGNAPPDPIDTALAPFGDAIAEAENWLDGSPVENEGQMKAVDGLLKHIKAAHKAVSDAEDSEAKPIYDQWKAAKARYAPTLADLDRIKKGLVSIVDAFKRQLAAEKDEAERKAREAALAAEEEFRRLHQEANAGDIEAQRAAAAAEKAAEDSAKAAARAAKDGVKGLRTVKRYRIDDHRAALHWIARLDREAVTAFVEEYVRRNHDVRPIDGVTTWTDREAF